MRIILASDSERRRQLLSEMGLDFIQVPSSVKEFGNECYYSEAAMPAVFSTELATCFRKLPSTEQKAFDKSQGQLYERAFRGIIHLRSDGRQMFLGRVYDNKPSQDVFAQKKWGWDIWENP